MFIKYALDEHSTLLHGFVAGLEHGVRCRWIGIIFQGRQTGERELTNRSLRRLSSGVVSALVLCELEKYIKDFCVFEHTSGVCSYQT